MSKETKNTISHRLRALDQFKIFANENPELFLGDEIDYDPEWDIIDEDSQEAIQQQQSQ
jgi:hypothetical protein